MPVTNLTKKTWLATKVRKADSFLTRLVGLLKRTNLGPEEALWLMPSKGIHTIGMKFPIDVAFLDKDNVVLGIISSLVPYRVTGVRLKGHSVLELPKGTLKKSRTEVGDQLEISALLSDGESIDRLITVLEANKPLLPRRHGSRKKKPPHLPVALSAASCRPAAS